MAKTLMSSEPGGPLPGFIDRRSMIIAAGHGDAATIAVESNPTGRFGVALATIGVGAGTSLAGAPSRHLISLFRCAPAPTRHSMAGKRSDHESQAGTLCICPAGADYTAEYAAPVHGVLLQLSTECLALAGAQLGRHSAVLVDQMNGRDYRLAALTRAMATEARHAHRGGALLWSSMADALLRHLAQRHLSEPATPTRGRIGPAALRRLDSFIEERLHLTIDLGTLAAVIDCDQYHFAHRFRATVGVSPYRYVVRRRLERARALLQAGQQAIAEVAASTGFTDQSHLTHWLRRVYAATPGTIRAGA